MTITLDDIIIMDNQKLEFYYDLDNILYRKDLMILKNILDAALKCFEEKKMFVSTVIVHINKCIRSTLIVICERDKLYGVLSYTTLDMKEYSININKDDLCKLSENISL